MSPFLAQVVASLESTNRLRSTLATKAAVLHEAATALRTGADEQLVASALAKHIRALHSIEMKKSA
jgi:hypothetical protein